MDLNSSSPVGRPVAAGLLGLFHRRSIASAVAILLADMAMVTAIGVAAKALLPATPQLPDFVAMCGGIVALVALVSTLGWWRLIGFNRPARWRRLHLLWVPALAFIALPFVAGVGEIEVIFRNPFIVLAQAVGAATEGVGLAAIRVRTNTIWPLIALHALEDLLLHFGRLPVIPVNVVQSVILFVFGLWLLRDMRAKAATAPAGAVSLTNVSRAG